MAIPGLCNKVVYLSSLLEDIEPVVLQGLMAGRVKVSARFQNFTVTIPEHGTDMSITYLQRHAIRAQQSKK